MDQFFSWLKMYKVRIAIIVLSTVLGVPLLIHAIFSFSAPNTFLAAKWSAGDLLAYISSVIGGFATVFLGVAVLIQNKQFRDDETTRNQNERNARMKAIKPAITIVTIETLSNANPKNPAEFEIGCFIKNSTHNIARKIYVSDIKVTFDNGFYHEIESPRQMFENDYNTIGIQFLGYWKFEAPSDITFDIVYSDIDDNIYRIEVLGETHESDFVHWEVTQQLESLISK